jgi:hypothetical protein
MVAPRKRRFQAREVRNTITVNTPSPRPRSAIHDRGCYKCFLLQQHDGNAGRKQDRADHMEPPPHLGEARGPRSRDQPIMQAEQEQEAAADQVEMGVRGRELKAIRKCRSSRLIPVFVT